MVGDAVLGAAVVMLVETLLTVDGTIVCPLCVGAAVLGDPVSADDGCLVRTLLGSMDGSDVT